MHTFRTVIDGTVEERLGNAIIDRRLDVTNETLLAAIAARGSVLKASPRSITRRVDSFVVKTSAEKGIQGVLNRTIRRDRHRRGWLAGLYLEQQGVNVPHVYGLVEMVRYGFVTASHLVMEYLENASNVERFAAEMARRVP